MTMLCDSRWELRLSGTDKATLEKLAKANGMNAAAYVRWVIRVNEETLTKSQ